MIERDLIVYFEKLDDWEKSVYVVTIDDERDDHWFQKLTDWKKNDGQSYLFQQCVIIYFKLLDDWEIYMV